jgi:hypothetical protein
MPSVAVGGWDIQKLSNVHRISKSPRRDKVGVVVNNVVFGPKSAFFGRHFLLHLHSVFHTCTKF